MFFVLINGLFLINELNGNIRSFWYRFPFNGNVILMTSGHFARPITTCHRKHLSNLYYFAIIFILQSPLTEWVNCMLSNWVAHDYRKIMLIDLDFVGRRTNHELIDLLNTKTHSTKFRELMNRLIQVFIHWDRDVGCWKLKWV